MKNVVRILCGLAFVALTAACASSAELGSEIPKQYKRIHQRALKLAVTGDADAAVAQLEKTLSRYPEDAESHYMLAEIHARAGRKDRAIEHLQKAVDLGLPSARFLCGADSPFAILDGETAFQDILAAHAHAPVSGPMLGCMTDRSVKIWVRTARPARVQAVVSAAADGDSVVARTEIGRSTAQTDHTVVVAADGLKPNTRYYYRLEIDGKSDPAGSRGFRTFPPSGKKSRFTIAFGGGAGYVPVHERMWSTIASKKPDALLLLGDNVYSDDPTTPEIQRYSYYRRQGRPEFRDLVGHVPVFTIWDDHDFGTNDCWGGPDADLPKWKRPVWNVFRQNWVNPAYGGGAKVRGCWYDFHIGDVHFIMLDGRYYRTNPRTKPGAPSMLGPEQKRWLKETVKASGATFKVICSPVPWTFYAKGDSRDTWNGFRAERTEIFDFLSRHQIDGVVLMSADRHRSDLWKIERAGAYPLYELNSSRLTNQHVHNTMKAAVFSYNKKQSFGLIQFDTTRTDPTVTYHVVTIDGEIAHSFTLNRSQLGS